MGKGATILLVSSLLLMSIGFSAPVDGKQNGRQMSEGGSVILAKEIFWSDEPFEATIGLWGLSVGRNYSLEWEIFVGNSTVQNGPSIVQGQLQFTANSSARQINFEQFHFSNNTIPYSPYRFNAILNSSQTGPTSVSLSIPFSVVRNTIPPQYTDLIVFGDSLSDTGNAGSESPPYWNNRFTNGPNWVDNVHTWLSLSTDHGSGTGGVGNNRAYGGASSGNGASFFIIPNMGRQVDDWDANHNVGPGEAVALWAGGNDFLTYGQQNPQTVADYIEEHATQLIGAGAQEVILFELPPLEKTPRAQEDNTAQENIDLANRIVQFNSILNNMASNLASTHNVIIHVIPIWEPFEMAYWSGEHFGITNMTHPACDHSGLLCSNGDPIASNAEEYIFFDKLHPSETTHSIISYLVQSEIGIPDYDGDGISDDSDNCPHTLPGTPVTEYGCDIPPPDEDNDGVPDDSDECSNTESGLPVDEYGCAINQIDSDEDGVSDADDQCPDTEEGRIVNLFGCSEWQLDSDLDGVVNALDDCPNTPTNEIVDQKGCSNSQLDSDEDSVNDADDACPNTDRGQDVNQVGCAPNQLDDDGDNVSNADDLCPNTIINSDDIDSNGCAPYQRDTDEDGVNDADDICPNTAWLDAVNEEGCSAKQRDTDGDGPKDADDSCPLIPGSISGCPILTIDVLLEQAPSIDSQIANISISITCESACLMNVTDVSEVKLLDGPISNVSNSTYYIEYSGYNETLFFNIEVRITGGEGFGSMWKVDELYVEFPAALMDLEVWGETGACDENCGGEQGDSQSASKNDDDGLKLDTGSIAMIAMLLLLNIGAIAAIMGARSRSKIKSHMREKSMQSFEQQLFQESVPSKNIKKFDDDIVDFIPPKKENNELPNMEDLLE